MTAGLPAIRRILYCTQLGPNAAYIFRYAYVLAERLGARIAVLHVVETLSARQEALVEGYAGQGALHAVVEREEQAAVARLERRVRAFCEKVAAGPGCEERVERIVVTEGRHPADVILEQVQDLGADLVVMGAHAEASLLETLMGGTAEKVARRCPVPVLLVQVPEGHQELTMVDP